MKTKPFSNENSFIKIGEIKLDFSLYFYYSFSETLIKPNITIIIYAAQIHALKIDDTKIFRYRLESS